MDFRIEQHNGLTIRCTVTPDTIVFEFTTDTTDLEIIFERASWVIALLQRVFNGKSHTIKCFGIIHDLWLEEYLSGYKLFVDSRVYILETQVVEYIRYLLNNTEKR